MTILNVHGYIEQQISKLKDNYMSILQFLEVKLEITIIYYIKYYHN